MTTQQQQLRTGPVADTGATLEIDALTKRYEIGRAHV